MFKKMHLKITQEGFENYNGPLSVYEFVDGVSVEPIPRTDRDRIAATMRCIEISENGKEVVAGVAERLVSESAERAPKPEKLKVQTVEEKIAEEKSLAEKVVGDLRKIYTEDELDQIIEDGGISGLREVADTWNVKNRSIPTLRQMVLDAQEEYVAAEGGRMEKAKAAVEKVVRDTAAANGQTLESDEPEKTIEQEVEDDEILTAAVTGDMSAAISDQNSDDTDTSDEEQDETAVVTSEDTEKAE